MVEGLVGQQVTYEDNPQTPNLVFIPLALCRFKGYMRFPLVETHRQG